MKLVEEGADVRRLRGHLGAGGRDDLWLQTEPRCDVEAGGGAGNSETQLVRRSEGLLIESNGRVEDAGVVGGVDLEGGEVRSDAAPGIEPEEVSCHGHGQGRALFGACGGS